MAAARFRSLCIIETLSLDNGDIGNRYTAMIAHFAALVSVPLAKKCSRLRKPTAASFAIVAFVVALVKLGSYFLRVFTTDVEFQSLFPYENDRHGPAGEEQDPPAGT